MNGPILSPQLCHRWSICGIRRNIKLVEIEEKHMKEAIS